MSDNENPSSDGLAARKLAVPETGSTEVLKVGSPSPTPAQTAQRRAPPIRGGRGRGRTDSGLRRIPGVRPMKEYPLTKGDMRDLAKTGAAATGFFAISSACFGYMVNLAKDLALAQNVPDKVAGFWNAIWWGTLAGSIIFALLGIVAVIDGRIRLREIERETRHPDYDEER